MVTCINSQGHRIEANLYKGERKYTSNYIAVIIKKPDVSVSIELINVIKEIRDINRMLIKINDKRF